ncbi:ParA family protein [Agromyces larvae]|uniref:AAA family ATPase n=1 Tax=Agromyces larvae TaxID=2929802 RepID=A0ABY4C7P5_9MICO|nr:ParA family protein [Agromyces larvae]UOE46201.1 AAA family ATPase [Agromyces larvae]
MTVPAELSQETQPDPEVGTTPSTAAEHPAPERDEASPPGSEARFDWDAATAAALTDSSDASTEALAQPAPHSNASADRLLEDIIREIVGDAAADTVSSLHQPKPAVTGESPSTAPASGPPSPDASAADAPTPESPTPPSEVNNVTPAQPVAEPAETADDDAARTDSAAFPQAEPNASAVPTPPTVDDSASITREDAAIAPAELVSSEGDRTPDSVVSIVPEAIRGSAAPPAVAPPAVLPDGGTPQTPLPTDVSRETSPIYGGTPLADQLAEETRRRIALEEAVLPLPPQTRVLTISNQKGGVGKTTSAVNLAAALARSGARVLVIDLDPQGNASTALGVDHQSEQQSVYEVLVSDLPLSAVVRPSTEHEHLDCVPATIHLAGAEIELVSMVAREQRLRRALDRHLESMTEPYHYVFIDCPPSLGLLTINAFVAAREVLIPIQCEYYALEGLSQLLSNIELIEKHLNPTLRLSTILLTMYDSRTNLAQQVAQEVRDHFPGQTLQTIIPRSVRVSEAPSYGQSVITYDYGSSGSLSYREAAAEIARRGAPEIEESN